MKDTLHVNGTLGADNYLMKLKTTNHTVLVDEPESVGGGDHHPNPPQYLLSALASCTAITIKMYANNKGWDVGNIDVDVKLKFVQTPSILLFIFTNFFLYICFVNFYK